MRLLTFALTLLIFTNPARAQFRDPPAPVEPEVPATSVAPPAPSPLVPPLTAAELIERGHHKKVVGATLIIVGAVVLAGGLALVMGDYVEHASCSDCGLRTLLVSGIVFDFVGTGLIGGGIPTYVVGASQMDRGLRLSTPSVARRF
jgi:hypothetical protein